MPESKDNVVAFSSINSVFCNYRVLMLDGGVYGVELLESSDGEWESLGVCFAFNKATKLLEKIKLGELDKYGNKIKKEEEKPKEELSFEEIEKRVQDIYKKHGVTSYLIWDTSCRENFNIYLNRFNAYNEVVDMLNEEIKSLNSKLSFYRENITNIRLKKENEELKQKLEKQVPDYVYFPNATYWNK